MEHLPVVLIFVALIADYPNNDEHFFVEADASVTLWANALNEVSHPLLMLKGHRK